MPWRFVGDLLKAEISEKQARSIKYQLAVAKLTLAKDVDDFAFKDTPINVALVRDLAGGAFETPRQLLSERRARVGAFSVSREGPTGKHGSIKCRVLGLSSPNCLTSSHQ